MVGGARPVRGFTLVEMLIVIGVVAILLGILLPALAGTRRAARSVECRVRLAGLMRAHQMWSSDHSERWANHYIDPTTEHVVVPLGGNSYGVGYFCQPFWWAGLLSPYLDGETTPEALACPTVFREDPERFRMAPMRGAERSYWYNPAFITEPALWDPDDPDARGDPENHRARVLVSSVRTPSGKVVMFETVESGAAQVNLAFADGHADRRSLADARPSLAVDWPTPCGESIPERLPFSTAHGVDGVDF